jgi:hypothetical protein
MDFSQSFMIFVFLLMISPIEREEVSALKSLSLQQSLHEHTLILYNLNILYTSYGPSRFKGLRDVMLNNVLYAGCLFHMI